MEATESPQPAATDAADASPPASVEASASPSQPALGDVMNAAIRDLAGVGSSSNLGGVVPTAELSASAPTAEPAPDSPGDVSAEGAAAPAEPGRRARKAQEAQQRIAELEAEIATLRPPVVDASEEARQKRIAAEQKFRTLNAKPDDDADWTTEDWNWLQEEKRKRLLFPEVQQQVEATIELERQAVQDERQHFFDRFREDMGSTLTLPGIDDATRAALVKEPSFAAQVLIHRKAEREAVTAQFRDEVAALRAENADLKRQMLGGTVAPPTAGMPSSAAPTFDMNSWIRQIARTA